MSAEEALLDLDLRMDRLIATLLDAGRSMNFALAQEVVAEMARLLETKRLIVRAEVTA